MIFSKKNMLLFFFIIPDPLSIIPHPRNGLASYKTPHLPQSSVFDPTRSGTESHDLG